MTDRCRERTMQSRPARKPVAEESRCPLRPEHRSSPPTPSMPRSTAPPSSPAPTSPACRTGPSATRRRSPTCAARFGGPLPERGRGPGRRRWRRSPRPPRAGSSAAPGPRYFGFVIGGSVPAALGADWLTSAWDQNAGLYVIGPAAAVAEEVAGAWLAELFGLPAGVSRRVHDRRDDGHVHGSRGRAPSRCSSGPAGTWSGRACSARRRSRSSSPTSRTSRSSPRSRCSASGASG